MILCSIKLLLVQYKVTTYLAKFFVLNISIQISTFQTCSLIGEIIRLLSDCIIPFLPLNHPPVLALYHNARFSYFSEESKIL